MGLALVSGPAFDPISIAEAKAHCRITSNDEDGLLAAYILAARQYVENECQLRIITQTLDYTIDDDWPSQIVRGCYRQRIEFPIAPVQSVTSITYVDGNGATQTLASNQYVLVNAGAGAQSGRPYIEPAYGVDWPTVRDQPSAITVRFVAGWDLSSVPNQLMQAMRLLIAHQNEQREPVNVGNIVTPFDYALEAFISPYRDIRVA